MSHCLAPPSLLTEGGGWCYHPRDMRKQNTYLVWLNWPIGAFRLNARSQAALARLLPAGARLVVARGERAFLRALPEATHAICWNFDKAWFARAPRLRVLATPAAGRELLPTDAELPPGVTRVNGAFHGQIMCETVLACILAHARGLYRAYDFQREGALWPRAEMSPFCSRVAGTRAVILGYGKIGRMVGARLEALGVSVTGIRRRNAADLLPALKTADWLRRAPAPRRARERRARQRGGRDGTRGRAPPPPHRGRVPRRVQTRTSHGGLSARGRLAWTRPPAAHVRVRTRVPSALFPGTRQRRMVEMNARYDVNGVEETWEVAKAFAAELKPGDVVCLEGDLGAGKTTFTQGVAAALGAKRPVTSPTFCLVVEHPTERLLLVHMDLYRLHDADDVLTIGWEDYLSRGAVLFVEWPDRAGDLIPAAARHVRFALGDSEEARIIEFAP